VHGDERVTYRRKTEGYGNSKIAETKGRDVVTKGLWGESVGREKRIRLT